MDKSQRLLTEIEALAPRAGRQLRRAWGKPYLKDVFESLLTYETGGVTLAGFPPEVFYKIAELQTVHEQEAQAARAKNPRQSAADRDVWAFA